MVAGVGLNLRPLGYEPNELPDCSIPRYLMAEEKGFEPLRRFRPAGFQDQSLQPDLGIPPILVFRHEQFDYSILLFG